MAVLAVRGLTKRYGETVAVRDLSFSVREGEVFGFLGPNGAGKTTTIRALLGFHRPTAGTAELLGADVRDERALVAAKRRVGYLPADPAFDEGVTGRTYLDFQAELKGDDRRDDLLALFDPPLDRRIREYSTGNRQMLGLVQTFMHDPDLVVMDEPTAGLDPLKQERFNEFVREEAARGTTVFLSSHTLSEVRRICDRVGIIRQGHLAALETVDDLLRRGGKHVRVLTEPPLEPAGLELDGVVDFSRIGEEARFTFTGNYDRLLAALADRHVLDLEVEEPPLEDVFMHFYGEAPEDADDVDGAEEPIDTADANGTADGRATGTDGDADAAGGSGEPAPSDWTPSRGGDGGEESSRGA